MHVLVKLYARSLQSDCSSVPLTIRNKHQFELTLLDLKTHIHQRLQYPFNLRP